VFAGSTRCPDLKRMFPEEGSDGLYVHREEGRTQLKGQAAWGCSSGLAKACLKHQQGHLKATSKENPSPLGDNAGLYRGTIVSI